MADISAERLRELVAYDPDTGVMRWRISRKRARAGNVIGTRIPDGYLRVEIGGRCYRVHRLAWLYVYGEWPPHEIDHINHVRDDNRLINLRLASPSQNQANKAPTYRNTSGHKGVSWHKQTKKWQAYITVARRKKSLGLFAEKEQAVSAYREAATLHFGKFDYYADSDGK